MLFCSLHCLSGKKCTFNISWQVFLHLLEFLPNNHLDVMIYLYMSLPVSYPFFITSISFSIVFDEKNWQTTSDWLCPWTYTAGCSSVTQQTVSLPRHNFELCCSLSFSRPTSSHSSNRHKTLTQQLHYKTKVQNIVSTTFLLQTVSCSGDG